MRAGFESNYNFYLNFLEELPSNFLVSSKLDKNLFAAELKSVDLAETVDKEPSFQFSFGGKRYRAGIARRLFLPQTNGIEPMFAPEPERPRGMLRIFSRG